MKKFKRELPRTIVILVALIFLIVTISFTSIGFWTNDEGYGLFRDLLTIILIIAGVVIAAAGYLVYLVLMGIIERHVKRISSEMASADEMERLRMVATSQMQVGYIYWLLYNNVGLSQFLDKAIKTTERAYSRYATHLDEDEPMNQRLICTIRNNLAYYYAKRRHLEDRKVARDYAEYIYAKIIKFPESRVPWEDTYNFVMMQYP